MSNFAYLWYTSTLQHYTLITTLVQLMGCEKYLELGIWQGECIHQVSSFCNYCVGVDIMDIRQYQDFNFKNSSSDDFFKTNNEIFDIIFIDADHNFESAKKDFINSLKILNKFGVIILHDTDPIDIVHIDPGYCGDSYKIIDWINENYSDLNVFTLPVTAGGMTLVNRKNDRRIINAITTI